MPSVDVDRLESARQEPSPQREDEEAPGAEVVRLLERERAAALATLAAEIAHTLATPIAYFRELFAQVAPATLLPEDQDAGREEIAKLELLLTGLRLLSQPRLPPLGHFLLAAVVESACRAAGTVVPLLRVRSETAHALWVSGDAQTMAVILICLLRALPQPRDTAIDVSVRSEGGFVVLSLQASQVTEAWRKLDESVTPHNLALLCAANLARLAQWPLELTSGTVSLRAPLHPDSPKGSAIRCAS